jgi:thiol-disulfide isomerase/thioredoxin
LQHALRDEQPSPRLTPIADVVPSVSAADLPSYGLAPDFAGVTRWLNTPGGAALRLPQLRGKVVLIDFWTYSCINCLRSLPHVEGWYSRYHSSGLEIVGVHTPEFDFEHIPGNVSAAVSRLKVRYPVAIDNDYGTWDAWGNNSWPAEYLIDATGRVRYGAVGEGDYGVTEGAIRALLTDAGAHHLPATTAVPDRTPITRNTPESYLGYERLARYVGTPVAEDAERDYTYAKSLPVDNLTYGGRWTVGPEQITAGEGAGLRINVHASDVFLVLAGSGTVDATLDGKPLAPVEVSGVPTLYSILAGSRPQRGVLELHFTPGLSAYAFTFG